jgi:hypothetical protein
MSNWEAKCAEFPLEQAQLQANLEKVVSGTQTRMHTCWVCLVTWSLLQMWSDPALSKRLTGARLGERNS